MFKVCGSGLHDVFLSYNLNYMQKFKKRPYHLRNDEDYLYVDEMFEWALKVQHRKKNDDTLLS